MGIYLKSNYYRNTHSLLFLAKALGKMTFFSWTAIMFTNTYYITCNFIMIITILGTEELAREQSNITQ
jgi:hypothetical protein